MIRKIRVKDDNETMKFNGETLKFDRRAECDWCGEKKLVGVTHYGTSHYNRLICKECAEEIKDYNRRTFGVKDSKRIKDAPDKYGLPTDEELEAEYSARREAIRKQREQSKIEEETRNKEEMERRSRYSKELNIIKNAKDIKDLYDLVPDNGQADTLAGELVRAFMRLEYRWYNDGDVYFEGYGYTDTCSAPATFICRHTDGAFEQDFFDFADENNLKYNAEGFVDYDKMGYKGFIYNLGINLFQYIKDNAESLMKPATDMYDEDGEDYFEYNVPKYTWDVEIPTNLRKSVDNHQDDVISHFESCFNNYSIHVIVDYEDIEVQDLELYDYMEAKKWDWGEIWDDFINNYLDGECDDDIEEDEDYEEDEE